MDRRHCRVFRTVTVQEPDGRTTAKRREQRFFGLGHRRPFDPWRFWTETTYSRRIDR